MPSRKHTVEHGVESYGSASTVRLSHVVKPNVICLDLALILERKTCRKSKGQRNTRVWNMEN